MNVMSELMRREETMLVPWLISMGHWRTVSANKQSPLYNPGEVILASSDAELKVFHDARIWANKMLASSDQSRRLCRLSPHLAWLALSVSLGISNHRLSLSVHLNPVNGKLAGPPRPSASESRNRT